MTDIELERERERQTDRQAGRQTDRQTDRDRDRETQPYDHTLKSSSTSSTSVVYSAVANCTGRFTMRSLGAQVTTTKQKREESSWNQSARHKE